ncbi:hypothetical protein FRACYDRAFT_241999 [Fragilariopsis cylindrus CCMP1102]|uniref:Uncharacterized protein n=1 Tax=Fragilariopsis cylindrus CCMP1102 TaxID=635003 RepID=A0A1E7F6L6_9STRA|nr:hypothetical protein FRACYDRAFT_241999 [Fragilariopsis cylindrus CCMP1102]|eukprot:OEU13655.1 hypothetical protein FRACYDRAFT_241999 [Fragilariopsis cylindrus CCMP1102]
MVNNSLQVRLQRSRRHRSWANSTQLNDSNSGDDAGQGDRCSSINSVGSSMSTGVKKLRTRLSSSISLSPTAIKTSTTPAASPKSNAVVLDTDTSSQESSNLSRRDRMMALSTKTSVKNKAERASYKNPSVAEAEEAAAAAVVAVVAGEIHSDQSSTTEVTSEYDLPASVDTQQHNNRGDDHPNHVIPTQQHQQQKSNQTANWSPKAHPSPTASSPCESSIYQASAMEDSDGGDEPTSTEGPPHNYYKNKIPHNRSFQSSDGGSVASPSSASFENKSINSNSNIINAQNWQQHSPNVAPLTKIHPRGGRVMVSRSPTAIIGSSTDSSPLAQQQQQFKHIPKSSNNNSDKIKKVWKSPTVSKVSRLPEVQRSISSARYGSPRNFTGSSSSNKSSPSQGCMYKNLLKPRQKEPVKGSHEREAFGAIIETPQKASVTSLHAMFDSPTTTPLMPMNSTDSRVRHSLPRNSSSFVKTGGVASRYRSVTGRSNISKQPSPEKTRPDTSSETVDDKSNEHNPEYEQTQQSSPNNVHQYYKAAVRVQVQNDILIKKEQLSEEQSTMTTRNDDPSVPTVYSEGPRSPQRQSVISSWNTKYKEEKQVQEIQQHKHTEKNAKTFVEPKSAAVEEKSRVLEYYKSSGRIDDAGDEQVESKVNKAFVDSSANASAGVVSSWNDDPEPTNDSDNVDAGGIQAITPKPDEPKAPSPSVSLVSAMYSHIEKKKEEKGCISDSTVESTDNENSNGQNITPKPDELKTPSQSVSLVSLMYSHIKKTKEEKGRTTDSTVHSTGSGNSDGQNMSQDEESKYFESAPPPTQVEDNYDENRDIEHEPVPWPTTESVQDVVVPQKSQESTENTQPSTNSKPWEKDTSHSIVQSWQMRSSSKNKDSYSAKSAIGTIEQLKTPEIVQSSDGCTSSKKDVECLVPTTFRDLSREDKASIIDEDVAVDEGKIPDLMTNSNNDYYIEEKKSGDLSINENIILGEDADGYPSSEPDCVVNTREDETSNHSQKKAPYYDDDSYINQNDSDRGLGASESFKTTSDRSRNIATWNSEDMSVYVEDERIISKKEDKILTAQFQQMNLEIDVECTKRQEEIDTPAVINSPAPAGKSIQIPLINPSPKDNDKYRIGYFGDETPTSIRGFQRRNYGNISANDNVPGPDAKIVQINNSNTSKEVFDVWASSSASNEERDEAIKFDETDQWLDRDPDIDNDSLGDDASVSSVGLNSNSNNDTSKSNTPPPQKAETDHQVEINAPVDFRNPSAVWSPPVGSNSNNDTSKSNTPPPQKAVTDHQVEINAPVDFRNPSAVWSPPVGNNNKHKQPFCTPEKQRIEKDSWKEETNAKQDVFDPFAVDDADEEDGLEVEISDNDLFSPDPSDPFATSTEESFSPLDTLEWSTPRGGSSNNDPEVQNIGYYTSPDSRVEI